MAQTKMDKKVKLIIKHIKSCPFIITGKQKERNFEVQLVVWLKAKLRYPIWYEKTETGSRNRLDIAIQVSNNKKIAIELKMYRARSAIDFLVGQTTRYLKEERIYQRVIALLLTKKDPSLLKVEVDRLKKLRNVDVIVIGI